jgi:two-component system cell cycle sensor histidine kinase PleC
MARASTAGASAQAEARLFCALFQAFSHLRHAHAEVLLRWGIPALLSLFVVLLVDVSHAVLCAGQQRAIAAAAQDVEFLASVIADDIDVRLHSAFDRSSEAAFAHAIPHRLLTKGQHVLLTNASGKIIAASSDAFRSMALSDALGSGQPLALFAEKAGVVRITLPDGSEALATIRSLHEPLGQVAVIQPLTHLLDDWRSAFSQLTTLLIYAGIGLSGFVLAYVWQASRARHASSSFRKMCDRVDLVLSRGRCGLWDWNIATAEIDWSYSMYEILGMAPIGQPLSVAEVNRLTHPADETLDAVLRRLSLGQPVIVDHVFRMRHASGEWVWLRAQGEIVNGGGSRPHLVGIAIDVTEAMALEERTARADMRLRDAIETISEAFVVWDADNKLVLCNSKFQRFHNLPETAIVPGTPYATVMAFGTPPVVQAQVPLSTPEPFGARTFEAQLGDGRWLQIDERRTKDGGYVSVGTDITALKRHEEQLIESERRLMHTVTDLRKSRQELETQAKVLAELAEKYLDQKAEAEKANRAKSNFLANMSHELRTPLNAILGFSEIMMMESYGGLGSPLYQEYCKDIHASGQYLLSVIADVLEMSRLDAGRVRLEKADFAVDEAIQAAIGSVASIAVTNDIKIDTACDADLRLHGDRAAIEKVLTILLNNSVKYTPPSGKVLVRTRSAPNGLNIYVEDTGVGITPDMVARLGRPFEQSDHAAKNGLRGSGLGLAIARSLVDLHGGTLRIKSKPGVGTLVQVHVPNRPASRPQLLVHNKEPRTTTRTPRFSFQSAPERISPRKISRTA